MISLMTDAANLVHFLHGTTVERITSPKRVLNRFNWTLSNFSVAARFAMVCHSIASSSQSLLNLGSFDFPRTPLAEQGLQAKHTGSPGEGASGSIVGWRLMRRCLWLGRNRPATRAGVPSKRRSAFESRSFRAVRIKTIVLDTDLTMPVKVVAFDRAILFFRVTVVRSRWSAAYHPSRRLLVSSLSAFGCPSVEPEVTRPEILENQGADFRGRHRLSEETSLQLICIGAIEKCHLLCGLHTLDG